MKSMNELLKYRGENIVVFASTQVDGASSLTGDTKATKKAVMPFKEITFFLNCSQFHSSLTSLVVSIIHKDPVSGEWHNLVTFSTLNAVGKEKKAITANIGDEIAMEYTLVGAYTATFSVGATAKIM